MKIQLQLPSGKALGAEVNSLDALGTPAWFERLRAPASALASGEAAEVELDWALLRLEADAQEVRILEPDYTGKDLRRWLPGVTATDRVFAYQARLARTLHITAQPVRSGQYLRVAEAALAGVSAFGHRRAEAESAFTGWQIDGTTPGVEGTFGQYSVRELAQLRLAWVVPLILPAGWSFRSAGHTLMDCVAPGGETFSLMLSVDV